MKFLKPLILLILIYLYMTSCSAPFKLKRNNCYPAIWEVVKGPQR